LKGVKEGSDLRVVGETQNSNPVRVLGIDNDSVPEINWSGVPSLDVDSPASRGSRLGCRSIGQDLGGRIWERSYQMSSASCLILNRFTSLRMPMVCRCAVRPSTVYKPQGYALNDHHIERVEPVQDVEHGLNFRWKYRRRDTNAEGRLAAASRNFACFLCSHMLSILCTRYRLMSRRAASIASAVSGAEWASDNLSS